VSRRTQAALQELLGESLRRETGFRPARLWRQKAVDGRSVDGRYVGGYVAVRHASDSRRTYAERGKR
jgi:hypothetical protein